MALEERDAVFGYIKPVKAELKVKEWEAYQGIYCGLCKQLAERYGLFARMTLNYDFVFLAVLDMGLRERQHPVLPPELHRPPVSQKDLLLCQ